MTDRNFFEFETFIKFPDNEILGKQGRYEKVKTTIDMSKIYSFYESQHDLSGESGVGIDFDNGSTAFVLADYNQFKKIFDVRV